MRGESSTQPHRDWSKGKEPSADIIEKKGRNFISLFYLQKMTIKILSRVFFLSSTKLAACRYFIPSNKRYFSA